MKMVELGPLIHIPLYYETRNSPTFSLRDIRASDMQACMKMTPPHLAFLEWGDFYTCSCFARSTIPKGKLRATCSLLSMQIASWIQRRCAFLLPSETKLAFKNTPRWTIIGLAEFVSGYGNSTAKSQN